MSDQAWIGLLGILVTVLLAAVGTLGAVLWRLALSQNTAEGDIRRLKEDRDEDRKRIAKFENAMPNVLAAVDAIIGMRSKRKKITMIDPRDSDDPEEG